MRARHGHSRLSWAGGIAAALALLTAALLWAVAPRGEPPEPPATLHADAPATQQPALPVLPRAAAPELPAPESADASVQSLAPPIAAELKPSRKRPATTTPTAFATLDLTLLQPCGLPAAGVTLRVRAPHSTWRFWGDAPIADDTGRIVLPELPAETPLWLEGTDGLRYEVLPRIELTLAPGETRVQTATLSRDLRAVVVQVRDRAGRPVAGAAVTLVAALTQGSTRTLQSVKQVTSFLAPSQPPANLQGVPIDEAQVFFPCMAAESVSVSAELEGFAPAWLSEVPLDRNPLLLELVLDSGFPVEVEIVDEAGHARDVDAVQVRGSPVTLLAAHVGPGLYRFTAFPEGANGITASVQGRSWQIDHTARRPSARIVVPASGELSVTWAQLPNDCALKGIFIYSEPPGWGWFKPVDEATRATGGPALFEDLAPGDYRIELHCPEGRGADRSARATVSSNVLSQVHLDP